MKKFNRGILPRNRLHSEYDKPQKKRVINNSENISFVSINND